MQAPVGDRARIGAGTVLTPEEVRAVAATGASFIVSPNADLRVIARTKALGLGSYPGVFTPTEAFAALAEGADALKIFPAGAFGRDGLKALRAVLPPGTLVYAVGGVGPADFADWCAAGADGFGLGSSLFQPGWPVARVAERPAPAPRPTTRCTGCAPHETPDPADLLRRRWRSPFPNRPCRGAGGAPRGSVAGSASAEGEPGAAWADSAESGRACLALS